MSTWADHDRDGVSDDNVIEDCQTYGTSFIVGKLSKRYSLAQLVRSGMMVELSAVVILRELCLRRGNIPPQSLEFRYQEITQKDGMLDQIVAGTLQLVDENGNVIGGKRGLAPTFSNLRVDRRYAHEQIRVVSGSSSNSTTQLEQDQLAYDGGYYNE